MLKSKLRRHILKLKCNHTKVLLISLYCLLFSACGKRIVKSKTSDAKTSQQTLSTNEIAIKAKLMRSGSVQIGNYQFTQNALVAIPSFLKVLNGNAANKSARIYFNVENGKHEFYCEYKGGANSPTPTEPSEVLKGKKYNFQTCYQDVNNDGVDDPLNYYPKFMSHQDKGNNILLEVFNSDSRYDTEVEAIISIEWH